MMMTKPSLKHALRSIRRSAMLCFLYPALAVSIPAMSSDDFLVTLLGTGTPLPSPERFGNSTLVEAGGLRLVFDAGRGAIIRLW